MLYTNKSLVNYLEQFVGEELGTRFAALCGGDLEQLVGGVAVADELVGGGHVNVHVRVIPATAATGPRLVGRVCRLLLRALVLLLAAVRTVRPLQLVQVGVVVLDQVQGVALLAR